MVHPKHNIPWQDTALKVFCIALPIVVCSWSFYLWVWPVFKDLCCKPKEVVSEESVRTEPVQTLPAPTMEIVVPVRFKYDSKGGGFSVTTIGNVTVTAYNNLPEQTNSSPNIGASNRKVFEGSIALSRDIIRTYSVKYGDVVCIMAQDKCYIVEDTMNKRFDNANSPASGWKADIFMYSKEEALKVNFKSDLMLIKQL